MEVFHWRQNSVLSSFCFRQVSL